MNKINVMYNRSGTIIEHGILWYNINQLINIRGFSYTCTVLELVLLYLLRGVVKIY